MRDLTFGRAIDEAFCWHCDSPIGRDGELLDFAFYVHLDGFGTCEPDSNDSTFAIPTPMWGTDTERV